ncbi:hypothetical protein RGQ15_10230 [Paracoccus sp. MBLB3053]|uniref:Phage tail protein n=1 Tax=Paracoccus aurantius TaxID=3073814 RepID=A0ABU2HT85_9RHOB|nr:hypothetical protein [Paracoccus sp. MBLB3053]MDS9467942.1 hypothetical protein [Paracoccus sp. MBLB3053]
MLYPTAGTRFFIADAPALEPGALPASGWVEIGETEALGLVGIEWEMAEADLAHMAGGAGNVIAHAKQSRRTLPMQIILGNDPEDVGQILLWQAAHAVEHYPFRLLMPDGVRSRSWFALVTAISEVFDAANSVMKLQVDLQPHHAPITRSEA